MKNFLILAFTGILCGFINGFLGTGGGIVIVSILGILIKDSSAGKRIFATSNFIILILSFVSIYAYLARGTLTEEIFFNALPIYLIPALFGGLCGALALDSVSPKLLKNIFYIIICYCGAKMLFF